MKIVANNEKYRYTPDCREISGFGGAYEEACRTMVIAGMEWFDQNKSLKEISYKELKDNHPEKHKEFDDCICEAGDGPSGAMYGASVSHIMFAKKNGWSKYIQEMETKKVESEDNS